MDKQDMKLARDYDAGLITAVELVETIIDDELAGYENVEHLDTLNLARRIVNALQY